MECGVPYPTPYTFHLSLVSILIGQLAACGINIFSAASSQSRIYFVFFQYFMNFSTVASSGFSKSGIIDGIVFNDIDKVGRNLPVNFYQFIRIFQAIIEILEKNIFKSDFIFGLLIKIIQVLRSMI